MLQENLKLNQKLKSKSNLPFGLGMITAIMFGRFLTFQTCDFECKHKRKLTKPTNGIENLREFGNQFYQSCSNTRKVSVCQCRHSKTPQIKSNTVNV